MQIVAGLLIIGLCSYAGRCLTNIYKRRERLFEDLKLFCSAVKNDISFFQLRLTEAFAKTCETSGKDLTTLCARCINSIEQSQSTLLLRQDIEKLGILNKNDTELLLQFFGSLGKTDSATQAERIAAFERIFTEKAAAAKQETKSKGVLFQRLSPFVGLLLVVLCL